MRDSCWAKHKHKNWIAHTTGTTGTPQIYIYADLHPAWYITPAELWLNDRKSDQKIQSVFVLANEDRN